MTFTYKRGINPDTWWIELLNTGVSLPFSYSGWYLALSRHVYAAQSLWRASPVHSTPCSRFTSWGLKLSLINFTNPHFCPQLFIGPYYENLKLLFDYRHAASLPPEASGVFYALLSGPSAINECCAVELRFPEFRTSNQPTEWNLFVRITGCTSILPERLRWKELALTSAALCVFFFLSFPYFLRLASSVWGYIPNRFVLLVSESISVPRRGPVGAPRKLELRTRNEMNAAIFMRVWERNPWWGSAEIRMEWHWIHGRGTRGKRALHHTGERLIAGRWSVRRGASRSAEWQWRARHALGGSYSWKPFDFCSHPRHGSVFYSGSSVNGGRPSYTVFPPFCFMREN